MKAPVYSTLVTIAALSLTAMAQAIPASAPDARAAVGVPAAGPAMGTTVAATASQVGAATGDDKALGFVPDAEAQHPHRSTKPVLPATAVSPYTPLVGNRATANAIFCTSCIVVAPSPYPLQAAATSVTVSWADRSNNELGFKVYRRNLAGALEMAYQVPTRNMAGGGDYSWVDTSAMSGQCYMIEAYSSTLIGDSAEHCTVRPDPTRFPQSVAAAAVQWSGLSGTNDGTGGLDNWVKEENLLYGNQTWGVDLVWGSSSLWRVEAQGGPHLMRGQALALRVWGGGWLKYGTQSFGVDLQLSDTPVYEWYAIGRENDSSESTWAGDDLTKWPAFALWNSSAQGYLVRGYQFWGIDLNWYRPSGSSPWPTPTPSPVPQHGVRIEQVLNCSVQQRVVEVWTQDLTMGGGFVDEGSLNPQYGSAGCPAAGSVPISFTPLTGHQYWVIATDKTLTGCGGIDDPQVNACRKMSIPIVGDAGGYTRTDIVDDGTVISARG